MSSDGNNSLKGREEGGSNSKFGHRSASTYIERFTHSLNLINSQQREGRREEKEGSLSQSALLFGLTLNQNSRKRTLHRRSPRRCLSSFRLTGTTTTSVAAAAAAPQQQFEELPAQQAA
jgi:hypothetical protein